ncbi:hypothetical protein ES703_66070 [subsurface metagenome]
MSPTRDVTPMSRTDSYTVVAEEAPPPKRETRMVVTTPPPSSVITGQEFELRGYLEDAVSGYRLEYKHHRLIINDVEVGSGFTGILGVWGYLISFDAPGTYTIYVTFDGDDTYEGC